MKPNRVSPSFLLHASLSMKHPAGPRAFAKAFGGMVRKVLRKGKKIYTWRRCGKLAANIARTLLPFLVVKKEEAKVAVSFQEFNSSLKHLGRGYVVAPKNICRKEGFRRKLRALNAAT